MRMPRHSDVIYFVFLHFAVVGMLIHTPICPAAGAQSDSISRLILAAGNTDDDEVRLRYLQTLRDMPEIDESLKSDCDKMIEEIDRFIHSRRLDYFGGTVGQKKDYDFGIAPDSPLLPITWIYRGRMVTWVVLESGGIKSHPKRRRGYLDIARGFFEKAAEAFPQNRIARMYLGEPIPPKEVFPPPAPSAPAWAVHQREALERLADIIEWWIDNRMQENGEYGGGWGDDCEMWRWWVPVLIGFDDPKISGAQARFSDALLSKDYMKNGYTNRMTDVEHTAEDSADAMTPMMHLDPDNEVWRSRALRLVELMENLWTGRNERGFLQFKSTYFTCDQVDPRPERACDTVYHPRAVQPALLYWQRTGDERLAQLFSAWMDTWVDAAARSERGKPAGIIPSAIHWPNGRVGGTGKGWWDPRNHGEYTLYLFPSAMSLMTHTLLLTHHMTGNEKYLEPIRSMAAARLRYLKSRPSSPPEPGTEAWCAREMGGLSSVVGKYRFVTGQADFDALLEREMSPYLRLRMKGDGGPLASALERTAEALRINFPGYTSEVRYTDRVLRFPSLFDANYMFEKQVGNFRTPDTDLLYSSVTGDPGEALYFPLNAVRWLTPPREIAALVTDSGKTRFAAELFHFGKSPRNMRAELYLLDPGEYDMRVTTEEQDGKSLLQSARLKVAGPRTRIEFELPPAKLCTVTVARSVQK